MKRRPSSDAAHAALFSGLTAGRPDGLSYH
jgi:hypothetical protein